MIKSKHTSTSLDVSASTFITVGQLADRFQINRFTIYRWLRTEPERLPSPARLFGRILFSEAAIAAFIADAPSVRERERHWGRGRNHGLPPKDRGHRRRPAKSEQEGRRWAPPPPV